VNTGQYEMQCASLNVDPYYPPGVIKVLPEFEKEPSTFSAFSGMQKGKGISPSEMGIVPPDSPKAKEKKPVVVLPDGLTQEFADILAMLRDEMLECDIQNLSITPNGVTFERVVIVKGTYDG
jgi:hypothetical protein